LKILLKKYTHIGFEIGLLLKGIFAICEILCGFAVIFLTPGRLNRIIDFIVRNELNEDPGDFIMTHLVIFGSNFSIDTQRFWIFYLLSHGIVKLTVILLLWRKKIWAYPMSVAVFTGFIVYQIYHFMHSHSILLVILTILDIILIWLTVLEYNDARKKNNINKIKKETKEG